MMTSEEFRWCLGRRLYPQLRRAIAVAGMFIVAAGAAVAALAGAGG